MNELVGKKIKVFLINAISMEGVVESSSNDEMVLSSNDKYLTILSPRKNIIAYYVFESYQKTELFNVEDPVLDNNSNDLTDYNSLVSVRIKQLNKFREDTFKKLTKSHNVDINRIYNYGIPGFIESKHNSSEEDTARNDSDIRVLSGLPKRTSSK